MVRQSGDRYTLLAGQTISAWQHPESTLSRRLGVGSRVIMYPSAAGRYFVRAG